MVRTRYERSFDRMPRAIRRLICEFVGHDTNNGTCGRCEETFARK